MFNTNTDTTSMIILNYIIFLNYYLCRRIGIRVMSDFRGSYKNTHSWFLFFIPYPFYYTIISIYNYLLEYHIKIQRDWVKQKELDSQEHCESCVFDTSLMEETYG